MSTRAVVTVAVAALVTACGVKGNGGGAGGGSGGGQAATCTGSLTGVVSLGITDCRIGWGLTNGTAILGNSGHISVSDESQVGSVGVTCSLSGAVRTGTFALADCTTGMLLAEVGPDSASHHGYMATYDSTKPASALGSGTITVTSFEVRVPEANGIGSWDVHGSAHGTLVPPAGVPWTGQVILDLTF